MIEKGDRSPSAEALVDLLRVFAVRHLTDYEVGDRVRDLVIAPIDDEGRQTRYGVEFKGRMRSNRRASVVERGTAEVERINRADGDMTRDEIRQQLSSRKRGDAQNEWLHHTFGTGERLDDASVCNETNLIEIVAPAKKSRIQDQKLHLTPQIPDRGHLSSRTPTFQEQATNGVWPVKSQRWRMFAAFPVA